MQKSIWVYALLLLLAATSVGLIQAGRVRECDTPYDGLLKRTKPTSYKLSMDVCTNNFAYNLTAEIGLIIDSVTTVGEPNDVVILHADSNLEILDAVYGQQGEFWDGNRVMDLCRNSEKQLLVVTMAEDLVASSEGRITIRARGLFGADGTGLARQADEEISVAKANLAHTSARSMFPCFDDNESEVNFELQVIHDDELECFSPVLWFKEKTVIDHKRQRVVTSFLPTFKPYPLNKIKFEIRRR